jgi:AcrR family transcriptional regulator
VAAREPSGRSRQRESEATRHEILEAAGELLATVGEQGLSIREVCAKAGVSAPTVYHHFGDKQALVDRVVDDCFAALDRALSGRPAPGDPVEALRWGFDRYVEYGVAHPVHYQLMFQRRGVRPTPAAVASYDRLRRGVAAIEAAGRLRVPVERATAAAWAAMHGVTSLCVTGGIGDAAPVAVLVRDAMIERLTLPAAARRGGAGRPGAKARGRERRAAAGAPRVPRERKRRWPSESRT